MLKPAIFVLSVAVCISSPSFARDNDDAKPVYVYAKDAHRAAQLKLSDENKDARICVRQKQLGSRVRFQRICLTQVEWIAYIESLEEMNREWNNVGKGLPPEKEFVGPSGF